MNDGSVTLDWFVRNLYLPLKEANWKEETAKVKRHIIQKHLIDPFAQVPLENFDRFTLELHLKGLAKTNCRDTVLQVRGLNEDGGFVDPGDYLKRFLKKLAEEISLPKLTLT
jgi:hypothetical protein